MPVMTFTFVFEIWLSDGHLHSPLDTSKTFRRRVSPLSRAVEEWIDRMQRRLTGFSLMPERCWSWPYCVYPAMHRRISSAHLWRQHAPTSLDQHSDVCCSTFTVHTTPSAIGVLQRLDHACGTRCPLNCDNTTLSESSNGCWRHVRGLRRFVTFFVVNSAV